MRITTYNENTAKNAPLIIVNGVEFYFSYSTLVAVNYEKGLFVHKNDWGNTTGKHLNWIDGGKKNERLTDEQLKEHIQSAMKEANINSLPTISL